MWRWNQKKRRKGFDARNNMGEVKQNETIKKTVVNLMFDSSDWGFSIRMSKQLTKLSIARYANTKISLLLFGNLGF